MTNPAACFRSVRQEGSRAYAESSHMEGGVDCPGAGRLRARAAGAAARRTDAARPVRPWRHPRRQRSVGVGGRSTRRDGAAGAGAARPVPGCAACRCGRRLRGRRGLLSHRRRGARDGGGEQRARHARRPVPVARLRRQPRTPLRPDDRRLSGAGAVDPLRHHPQRHPDPGLSRGAGLHGHRPDGPRRARRHAGARHAQPAGLLGAAHGRHHLDHRRHPDRRLLVARLARADGRALLCADGARGRAPAPDGRSLRTRGRAGQGPAEARALLGRGRCARSPSWRSRRCCG